MVQVKVIYRLHGEDLAIYQVRYTAHGDRDHDLLWLNTGLTERGDSLPVRNPNTFGRKSLDH